MARKARIIMENGIYHVMLRGNNKNKIFLCDNDFIRYLQLLKENKIKYNLKLFHYSLMDNHVHLMIKALVGKHLSEAIKRINVLYVVYYRKKYGGVGHFFQDRFKSCLIEDGKYLLECARYIELNPIRASIVNNLEQYKWISYHYYKEEKKNTLIDFNPEYLNLSHSKENRIWLFNRYLNDGIYQKFEEKCVFKYGAYGSKEFMNKVLGDGSSQK